MARTSEPVVCVAYPNKRYEGTSFTGAAFSVSEVPDAPSKSACFEDRTGDQKTHWENIGGVQFKASLNGDAGTSHGSVHSVYLTFHNGRCYDLEIRMSYLTSTCCDAKEYKKMELKAMRKSTECCGVSSIRSASRNKVVDPNSTD